MDDIAGILKDYRRSVKQMVNAFPSPEEAMRESLDIWYQEAPGAFDCPLTAEEWQAFLEMQDDEVEVH